MAHNSNPNLMDTEPGGENTQYEGIKTFQEPPEKEQGQFKDPTPTDTALQSASASASRGEQTAENVRFGQAISENGFGGQTVGMEGKTTGGPGGGDGLEGEGEGAAKTRSEQGYGRGSGVGA